MPAEPIKKSAAVGMDCQTCLQRPSAAPIHDPDKLVPKMDSMINDYYRPAIRKEIKQPNICSLLIQGKISHDYEIMSPQSSNTNNLIMRMDLAKWFIFMVHNSAEYQ